MRRRDHLPGRRPDDAQPPVPARGRQRRRPGVLVFPEAFGLGEHALSQAERLAELGYVALACDLHGDGKVYAELGEVMPLIGALREAPEHIRARARGGLDALTARPEVDAAKVAAIGFCFGGTMALELARGGADVAGRGGLPQRPGHRRASATPKNIKGKVLVCIGADDPGVPPEQRAAFEAEMREGRVDWQTARSTAAWCTASPTPRPTPWADPRWRATTPARTAGPGRKCWPCSRKSSKGADAAAPALPPRGKCRRRRPRGRAIALNRHPGRRPAKAGLQSRDHPGEAASLGGPG